MAAPACLTVTLARLTHTISTNFRIPYKKEMDQKSWQHQHPQQPLSCYTTKRRWPQQFGRHMAVTLFSQWNTSITYISLPLTTRWPGWMRGRVQEAKKRRHLATLAEPLRSGKSVGPCSFSPPPTRSPPHICIQRHSKGPRPDLCSQIPSQLCGAIFLDAQSTADIEKGCTLCKNTKNPLTPIFFSVSL